MAMLSIAAFETRLLWALNAQEASLRRFVMPRYEAGFYRRYLRNNPEFAQDEKRWGRVAISSSYGPWQIMYATAKQFGYRGDPRNLSHAFVSLPYVVRYLRYLSGKFDGRVDRIVSAYNAGPGGVGSNPRYTRNVLDYLSRAPEAWTVYGLE
ncbi:MAG: lytic transglycosylase domain-containing protein [Candidatus Omnitrophica bacterium]|nr:lytic transglycosylase domain-containing protein [Candidatus Omnitrophota bacterium]